ncbi:MAG: double-strand break repair protein AddB [Alphaproteobacteria bacterium]|nr:double-strand break repair protein AddB [Alphaproteobacteria bacterium]
MGAVFTIDPDQPFVDILAAGVLTRVGWGPLELSRVIILLPTRRACRALSDVFLRQGGGRPMLLPRLLTLGDLDEDEAPFVEGGAELDLPPAIPHLRRHLLLAQLILAGRGGAAGIGLSPDQAVRLAEELGRLLDQVQTEQLSFARLKDLVPDAYAEHWQITLDFLKLLTEHWPRILADEGAIDTAERHNRLSAIQTASWLATPPPGPVIAAGSTGSIPATASLLEAVASLPQGAVVLPGLDRDMDEESWQVLTETHPQYGLKRLLGRLGIDRTTVADWPGIPGGLPPTPARGDSVRRRLIAEVMRPAATTHRWRDLAPLSGSVLDGLERLESPGPREEALAIALMMRQSLETPERTAALITPDRALARRVAAELGRWGIIVDDSAGQPLSETSPGIFLRLTADMVAEAFAPLPLLAALKHPLAAAGLDAGRFRSLVRLLERWLLRGSRPAPGLAGLRATQLAKKDLTVRTAETLSALLDRLTVLTADFAGAMAAVEAPLTTLVKAHMIFAETLAATNLLPGPERLWRGDAGEVAARFAADLFEAASGWPSLAPQSYPRVLEGLMAGTVVRPRHGGHPRLAILGPLEARLQQADLLILGGLNEGTWPAQTLADPWLSRPMRGNFGLPLPERRIGLSAHDFAQACCAPRVVLSRATRVDGTPTVPSRWLLRLDAVLSATRGQVAKADPWLAWANALDQPSAFTPATPPMPRPPLAARPRQLSVTAIETWMCDPYAIYAHHVLRLKALDPLDADPGAADYGSLVHLALEKFAKDFPEALPADAETALLAIGREAFADVLATPGVWAFWWPRFERTARWVVAKERERRLRLKATHTEVSGKIKLEAPGGPFILSAKADRIDVLNDGDLAILDYKTGVLPSAKAIAAGYAPQLPLEAAMAQRGGFAGVAAGPVTEIAYWRLKGGEPGGEERPAGTDPAALADEAYAGLQVLIDTFDDPATPYQACPHPERAPKYSDTLHLARVKEWASMEGEAED